MPIKHKITLTCSFLAHLGFTFKNPLENLTRTPKIQLRTDFKKRRAHTNRPSGLEGSETDKDTAEDLYSLMISFRLDRGFYRCPCPVPSPVCGEMITTRFAGEYFSIRQLPTVDPLYFGASRMGFGEDEAFLWCGCGVEWEIRIFRGNVQFSAVCVGFVLKLFRVSNVRKLLMFEILLVFFIANRSVMVEIFIVFHGCFELWKKSVNIETWKFNFLFMFDFRTYCEFESLFVLKNNKVKFCFL